MQLILIIRIDNPICALSFQSTTQASDLVTQPRVDPLWIQNYFHPPEHLQFLDFPEVSDCKSEGCLNQY